MGLTIIVSSVLNDYLNSSSVLIPPTNIQWAKFYILLTEQKIKIKEPEQENNY